MDEKFYSACEIEFGSVMEFGLSRRDWWSCEGF
jgi:hypothetical protein